MGKIPKAQPKPPPPKGRQERFVAEYLIDLNATQAAIRAGYSKRTAEQQGSRLLTNVKIAEAIREGKQQRASRLVLTQDRVLEELALLALSNLTHYRVDDAGHLSLTPDAPPGAERAISSIKRRTRYDEDGNPTVEVELKLWDKPGPLKLAGRHVGIKGFHDRIEVSDPDGKPLIPSREDAIKALRAVVSPSSAAPPTQKIPPSATEG